MQLASAAALAAAVFAGPAAAESVQGSSSPCFFQTQGASYDLSDLTSSTQAWVWQDKADYLTANSSYTFSVCTDVPSQFKPLQCTNGGSAPAYQVDSYGSCYKLGASFNHVGAPDVVGALARSWAPAAGVSFTYFGGDQDPNCPSGPYGQTRSFTLEVICSAHSDHVEFPPATAPNVDTTAARIEEVDTCEYIAKTYSVHGCPLECPRVDGKVCGGNGICNYDTTARTARCFCYDDWMEADCQTPRSPFPGGSVFGALLGGAILGTAGLLGFAYWRDRKAASAPQVGGFY